MKLSILILEDEPEVRSSLERDLLPLVPTVRIEPAEDVADAWETITDIEREGDRLALALCDHRLPGTSGVDFMIQLTGNESTEETRKVLVTGQADLEDTVRAVNNADLDHFIAKPWAEKELQDIVREQLTNYVIACGINPLPFMDVLDQPRALNAMREFGRAD
jgi:Response regulator containing CheY-like receiver, AAA-type ATPase, and DNA-binding domains